MQSIRTTASGWLQAIRLHLPSVTSPNALHLLRSVQAFSRLTPYNLTTLHDATRKPVLRRLRWAVEAGLLHEIRRGPDPYRDVVYVTTGEGESTQTPAREPIGRPLRRAMYLARVQLARAFRPLADYLRAEGDTIREVLTALIGCVCLVAKKLGAVLGSVLRLLRYRRGPEHAYRFYAADRVRHRYHAVCNCGWISPPLPGTQPAEQAFREHVRSEDGTATVYVAWAICENCGYTGRVKILASMTVGSGTCPHCRQRYLTARHEWPPYQRLLKRKVADATGTTGPGPGEA